jgi:hypothetical protein
MNDLENLIRKESNRYQFLKLLYDKNEVIHRNEIIEIFSENRIMSEEETGSAYVYLMDEKLIALTSADYTIAITHIGVKEIEASIRYPDKSTTHFSNQAIQFVIQKVIMGDNFESISDSMIINHSSIENAFNKVKTKYDEETANALKSIEKEINASGSIEAAENFESFSDELSKPQPKKSILKTLWKGTLEALPRLVQLTSIVSNIEKLL